MNDLDAADLLARYDAQLRAEIPDPSPKGLRVERDGPLVRFIGWGRGGSIGYRDLGGIYSPRAREWRNRAVAPDLDPVPERAWEFESPLSHSF